MSRFTFTTCCLLGFSLGIWVGTGSSRNLSVVTAVACILLLVVYILQLWRTVLGFAIGCLIAASLGFSHVASHRSRVPRLPPQFTIATEGTITRPPDNRDAESRLVITTNYQGRQVTFLAKVPPFPRFTYGDVVHLSGMAEQAEIIENFNYPLFLERQGITHQIPRATVRYIQPGKTGVQATLYKFRSALESRAEQRIPEPEASLLNGILLGSRQNLSESLVTALRNTGTSHIVAISGANITIVVGMLVRILPLSSLPAQRNATIIIGTILSLMSGASASVVRGSLVAGIAASVRAAGRLGNATSLILFPAACMLVINPLYLKADPSFQLSISAYVGIVLLTKPLEKLLHLPLALVPAIVRPSVLETVAATIGTLPVSITTFGSVSWVGLIANPAVLWLLPFITSFGGLFLVLPYAGVSDVLWLLLHSFLRIISLCNQFLHA